jgi:hypothetical protein
VTRFNDQLSPRTASDRSLSGSSGVRSVRNASAVAPATANNSQRSQRCGLRFLGVANATNSRKRPVRLVRIEKVRGSNPLSSTEFGAGQRIFGPCPSVPDFWPVPAGSPSARIAASRFAATSSRSSSNRSA